MRSLIIISISVVLSGGYLEWTMLQSQQIQIKSNTDSIAKVIKGRIDRRKSMVKPNSKGATSKQEEKFVKVVPKSLPLDLTLPLQGSAFKASFPTSKRASYWPRTKLKSKEAISYNAELVFDAKEGSSITGGKVNIKIPFG